MEEKTHLTAGHPVSSTARPAAEGMPLQIELRRKDLAMQFPGPDSSRRYHFAESGTPTLLLRVAIIARSDDSEVA